MIMACLLMKPYARVKFTLEEKKTRVFVPFLASCSYKVTEFIHSEYTNLSFTSHSPKGPICNHST